LRQDQTAFLFVFAQNNKLNVAQHDIAAQKDILRSRFGDDGWECPEILVRLEATDDLYFDAVSQIRMPRWSRGRVALIGDAAYSPSLLAGAGSAFAMLGAYILAGELKKARGDHMVAFAGFEGAMRGFIEKEQKSAAGFAQSFAPKTALGIFLRDRVLDTMRIPALADWIVRRFFANAFNLPDYGD
jgi:2-polyprenyl-6-methoxyphenol hydroxylase-like FAD-dependent oxidoreductase